MRIRWIDIAKGIGILLVTAGHTRLSGTPVCPWITSFHMPLFFVVAGICFDENRYATYREYALRKCRALLYPYVGLSFFAMALFSLLCFDSSGRHTVEALFRGMVAGDTIGPFWFFTVLLLTELFYGAVARCVRSRWARMLFCVFCIAISIDLTKSGVTAYFLNVVFLSMGFYGFGHLIRGKVGADFGNIWLGVVAVVAFGAQIAILATVYKFEVGYVCCRLGVIWYFFPCALLGCLATLAVSRLADQVRPVAIGLEWLGKNSISLFVLHGLLGVCRASWGIGACGYVLEYALLAFLAWAFSSPLHFFISPDRFDKTGKSPLGKSA